MTVRAEIVAVAQAVSDAHVALDVAMLAPSDTSAEALDADFAIELAATKASEALERLRLRRSAIGEAMRRGLSLTPGVRS